VKKIILAAGVYPPQIGGPAKYAKNLHDEFLKQGYEVSVVMFVFEHKLPSPISNLFYFFKLLFKSFKSDVIISFDTFTTGLPVILVSKILNKKSILRIGGDFLWENHINSHRDNIPLPLFYKNRRLWSIKDKIIYSLSNFQFKHASALVFNSNWLMNLYLENYSFKSNKCSIVRNFFNKDFQNEIMFSREKRNFLWAGRDIPLKNLKMLKNSFNELISDYKDIGLEIISDISHEELQNKIKNSYALVLPSISDVSPNFILEGIGFGKPFLVTKYTGIIDDFNDCGVFVDPLNSDSIKKGLVDLLNEENYKRFRDNINQKQANNSWTDISSDFIDLIKKI
jgi:glycosyltransferase involved in cell wall biosynthesis